ncbi:MAG: hypothetical protein R3C10_09730 [Pirellulales bacterium]
MSTFHENGRAEGERRKAKAHSLLSATRDDVIRRARHRGIETLVSRGWATIDDVHGAVEVPPGINPKCFGPVFAGLARAGICRADGTVKTGRREAHARPETRWTLTSAAKAREWQRRNPLVPGPPEKQPTVEKSVERQRQLPLDLSDVRCPND